MFLQKSTQLKQKTKTKLHVVMRNSKKKLQRKVTAKRLLFTLVKTTTARVQ